VNGRKGERVTGATVEVEGERKWGRKEARMNECEVPVRAITTELRDWIHCSKKPALSRASESFILLASLDFL
jgi:hypothetical protein